MWVESVAFDLPAPTHSDETIHVEASISDPSMLGLEYENPICNPAVKDIVVEHEHWAVNASLEIPSVFEGNEIAGRIILDNAPFEDCTAIVVVGNETIEVPIPANAMEVEFTVDNPNDEDPFIDASSIEAHIESINGGGYDEVNLDDPVNVSILDTIDEVKFAISGEAVDETAATAAFTITSDDPVQTGSLTVVASIGGEEYSVEMELIDGSWIGHVDVPVRENDLLINGKDTIEAHIVSARHDSYEWENPNYGKATEATVIDNVDDAVFNTAIAVEDGQYVVEVTSAQPNSDEGHPTLTLTVNGESRQIDLHWDDAREMWTESATFDLPAPTHSDETVHVEASISNPSMLGLEYENPICNSAVKDIVVEHEPWHLNAHLEVPSVFEGNEIAGKIVLDKAPFDDGCIAVVKVGDATVEVPIPANAAEVEFTVENPNTEDPFIDASEIQAEIVSITGGGYDSVSLEDPITVSILDTIDEVKFAITGESVDETAETVTFTVTSDDPVQTGALTVVANIDGKEYSVEMELADGSWIGHVEVPVRENDLLINGKDTIEAYVVSAKHDSYEWENPNYGNATEATVIDNVDDAVFNTAINVVDGQYVVEVTSVQPNSSDGHPTLTLTVNGESQQIDLHWDDARDLWVESVSFDLPAPTHSDETVHVEASISDPSMLGLEYENPILNPAVKDIVVEHEYWPVNARLEMPSVFEGNEIAGNVILDNAPVDDCIATVKIGDATVEVPVEAGKTEASFTVDNPNTEDPFIDASSVQAEIVSIDGGRYDEVNLEDPITVDILDTIDEVKFAITGEDVDETAETVRFTVTSDDPVQTGALTAMVKIDGEDYSVDMEWTDAGWVGHIDVPVRDNDLLINGEDVMEAYVVSAQHDSYEWENPNYGDETEATVIDNMDDAVFNTSIIVNESTYVVEVTSAQPNSNEGHPTLTLTVNGESQQIDLHWDEAREFWVESVSFDLPAHGINDETLHVEASISDPSMNGLEYENPILNSTETDIFIEHEPYNVYAHLEIPTVFEGNDIVGTIVLDNPPREDCTALVKVGDALTEVPIPANALEVEFTVENPNTEDPFIDASFVNAEIVSIEGGGYDDRTFDDPVRVDILDTIDEVKFSITGEAVDETAETVTFTVTSDDPVQTGSLSVIASIDGVEYAVPMEWTESGWTGQVEVPVRENDLLINGKDTIEAHIVSAQHDSYEWENPNYGKATEATVIDNVDDAVFNTAIAVEEDQYIVEVTSVQPYSEDGFPTVTLTVNGESQQIDLHWDDARELWTESVSYPLPSLTDVPVHLNASVSNPSMFGLEYENPICNSTSTVIVPEPFSGDPLLMTVDESYIPSGSKHGKGDGHLDSAYLGAPESGADAEYSLSFASAATEIVAVVDGLERDVFLQMLDDGSVVGRVQVNAIKTADVFSVSIDETGHVSLELTGNASMLHLASRNEGEEIVFSGITVRMESEGETAERPIEMHFKDDTPYLLEDAEDRVARIVPIENQADNLLDCGPAMDFTMGSSGARFKNGTSGVQHWAAEGVTLSAAIVKFDDTGRYAVEVAPPVDSLEGKTHYLAYSGHNSNQAKPWNWGLNVKSSSKWEHWAEISYDIQEKESQAVVFDLGGKLAYGITVEFGACYDPNSSIMANDRQFPEAALVVFFRDGEMVGQEIASGLSTGMDSRTFGAAVAGGFDKAVVSSLDNDSIDPKPRNQYQHVSDNEFTIRSVDFAVHPRMEPVHSVEGDLLLESGADGMAIAQKAVMFDVDAMGTSFDAVFADGTVHTVTLQPEAGGTCLNAVAEDGSIVFNAVVGSDGIWNANIYQTFTKAGSDVDDDGTSWLSLAFRTGEDADGDHASAAMLMPTQWVDDALPVAVNVEIEAVDHTVAADAALVHADIDETMLGEGSSVEISINGQSHVLNWNGSGFDPVEGFDFAWHQGSISWVEEMPPAGQMLEVTVVQRWIDGTGNEMTAYGEDNAQRALDVTGRPVQSDAPMPNLQDWLDSQPVDDLIADLTGSAGLPSSPSGEHPDLPASAPLTSSAPNPMDTQDYAAAASSTELDSIVMTMQTSAG